MAMDQYEYLKMFTRGPQSYIGQDTDEEQLQQDLVASQPVSGIDMSAQEISAAPSFVSQPTTGYGKDIQKSYLSMAEALEPKLKASSDNYARLMKEREEMKRPGYNEGDQIMGAIAALATGLLGGEAGALSAPKSFDAYQGFLKEQKADKQKQYQDQLAMNEKRILSEEAQKSKLESERNKYLFGANTEAIKADNQMKQKQASAQKSEGVANKQMMSVASALRKEYQSRPQVKNFDEIESSFNKISSFAKDPSGAGDIGLVFSFMKILDPTSTVREGEYATASNAGGVPDKVRGLFNKLVDGQFLSKDQRQDFANQAAKMYNAQLSIVEQERESYTELANQYGIDPNLVISRKSIEKKTSGPSLEEKRKLLLQKRQQVK